jgi:4,5-dihydroxyphthalate decarboxylase
VEKIDLDLELNLSIQPISKDDTLNELLDNLYNGKIDALISARVPSSFLSGSSNVVRLFPNYYEVEKEYYRRTKLFPIMHLIVVRNKILEKHPWVAGNLLKAFELSKKLISEEISSNCCVKDHFTVPT